MIKSPDFRGWIKYLLWRLCGIRASGHAAADWDRDYTSGHWRSLDGLNEAARYGVIAAWAQALCPAAILDVGCGNGVLTGHLKTLPYQRYLGVDLSPEAIREAAGRHADARSAFQAADAKSFWPEGVFDLIVFNEILYYLGTPKDVLAHYRQFVAPDGKFIVSMFDEPRNRVVWDAVHKVLSVEDSVSLKNRKSGTGWIVELLGPLQD
jgi:2-polyprenyl-3-methyl-5-hydroxy-6-metoxy-1,4-benzoquinol methylase